MSTKPKYPDSFKINDQVIAYLDKVERGWNARIVFKEDGFSCVIAHGDSENEVIRKMRHHLAIIQSITRDFVLRKTEDER